MNAEDTEQPVRTIVRMRAREGCEEAFERAWRSAAHEISRIPGNLRQELSRDAEDPRARREVWTLRYEAETPRAGKPRLTDELSPQGTVPRDRIIGRAEATYWPPTRLGTP